MKKERERDLLMFTLGNRYLSPPLLLQSALVSVALMSTPHGRGATQNPIHAWHNYHLPRPEYTQKKGSSYHLRCNKYEVESISHIFTRKTTYSLKIALQWFFSNTQCHFSLSIKSNDKDLISTTSIITWRRMLTMWLL